MRSLNSTTTSWRNLLEGEEISPVEIIAALRQATVSPQSRARNLRQCF